MRKPSGSDYKAEFRPEMPEDRPDVRTAGTERTEEQRKTPGGFSVVSEDDL